MIADVSITPDFVPRTPDEWNLCMADWEWRIYSGKLYRIMIKGEDGEVDAVLPFRPNAAQRRFLRNLHYRNIILKARQLGFTTLVAILWLDHALFNGNQRCGIIAQTEDKAAEILSDKIKFAYDGLPDFVKEWAWVKTNNETELHFGHNNSSIRCATSMRGGTIHRLHISEMGKIAKEFRKKAREIVTGSLPAVPKAGIAIIESTAEGQEGEFHAYATRAQRLYESGQWPTLAQYQFHFFPWFTDAGYRMKSDRVAVSPAEHLYFTELEQYWNEGKRWKLIADKPVKISLEQRAWYISQRDETFGGDGELMWQEFPSTPDECWQRSTEGTYYAKQLSAARSQGRITRVPYVEGVRVNTFWDIGASDGTAIWLHQYIAGQNRWIGFVEGWDEPYSYYVRALRDTGYIFGAMCLPHDAVQKRQAEDRVKSPLEMLSALAPDWDWHIIPRVDDLQHGIQAVRQEFGTYWFDADACKEGLVHLAEYRKRYNKAMGEWSDHPDKDNPHTEAADALRQHAQGFDPSMVTPLRRSKGRRRLKGGMAI